MLLFILKRFLNLIPVFFGSTILVFFIIQAAPGDFLDTFKENPRVKPAQLERLTKRFGLDKPWFVQYGLWVKNLAEGDLGESFTYNRPVSEVIGSPIKNSLVLVIGELILLYAIAIPIGIYGAVRQYSLGDKAISVFSYFFLGFPSFFLGLIVVYILLQIKFTTKVEILPIGNMTSSNVETFTPLKQFFDVLWHAIAPTITLTVISVAGFSRFMRGQMLEFMNQDYVRTARSKGLSERVVIYKHALRNAITPFVATIGGILPGLISGAGFVEYVFNWPGITPVTLTAINEQDVYVFFGLTALTLVLLVIGNLISDFLLAAVDPRVRYG